MKKGNRLLVILMVILLFSTLGACVEGKGPVPVFTLDKTSIELTAGGNSEALTLTIANVEETPAWESSDESVATVTVGETANVATVRGLAEGTAVITAKAGEQVAVCTVNVLKGPYITVLTEEITVAEGATEIIKVDTNIEGLNYTSENEEIATVDVQGVVSGIAEGTAEITVTGLNQSATVKVTVVKPYVKLNTDEVIMRLGQEEEVRLTAESNGKVVWSSSDENIVTVNNGVLTAVSVGEAVVTAKYAGATAECVVKVKSEIVTVTLSETELTVEKDGSAQLTVTLSPEQEGDDALINWSVVSGEDVVSVSEDGTVTSLGIYGTAVVRATLAKDTDCYAECTVTVPDPYADWLAISDRESFEAAFKSGNTEKNMYLVGDIDLGGAEYGAVLMSGYYNGTIEGRGYEIYNFSTVGLFDGLAENALIKDLAITCSVANMGGNFGIFGLELNGTVQNCRIDITFGSTPFQSVFGRNAKGNVSNTIILARNPLNTNNVFAGCVQGGGKWNSVYYAVYGGNVNAAGPTLKSEEALTQSSLYEDWNTEIWNIVDGEIPVHKNGGNIGELKVELGVTDAIIHLGDTLAVVATVKPAKLPAEDKAVVWSSSDETVAVVDASGVVTALKEGTAVITATSVKEGEKSASCSITVDAATEITLVSAAEIELEIEGTATVEVTVSRGGLTYRTSDEKVAIVDNGKIYAVGAGTAVITVTSDESNSKWVEITVTVLPEVEIKFAETEYSLEIGEELQLEYTVNRPSENDAWDSSDAEIVTVENGVITALKAGTVTVTLTSGMDNAKSASVKVTVMPEITLTVAVETLNIQKDTPTQLAVNVSRGGVTYSSSNEEIATVDENGVITGIADGEVVITVTSVIDETKTATVTVVVKSEVEVEISLNKSEATLDRGETMRLAVTVNVPGVKWESSNEEIATVDENGLVTALADGTVTITVTSLADETKSAVCNVTVAYVVPVIEVNAESVSMEIGGEYTLDYKVNKGEVNITSNRYGLSVDGNVLTAYAAGNYIVTLKSSVDETVAVTVNVTVNPAPTVAISNKGAVELGVLVGGTVELKANANREGALSWSTSDVSVLTVDENGVITGIKAGTATVTVTFKANGVGQLVTDSVEVTVTEELKDPHEGWIKITDKASFLAAFTVQNAGQKMYLDADIDLEGMSFGMIIPAGFSGTIDGCGYEIYNFSVGSLFDHLAAGGVVKNLAVTCVADKTGDHAGLFGLFSFGTIENCYIDYTFASNSTQSVFGRDVAAADGGVFNTIVIARNPSNAGNKWVGYIQSPDKVKNVYYYLAEGNTIIASGATEKSYEALTQASLYGDWDTTVWNIVDGEVPTLKNGGNIGAVKVELDKSEAEGYVGETIALVATVKPAKLPAADKTVVWTSSDEEIATVDENGYITLKKAGTVVITATSVKDGEKSASCAVTVIDIEPFGIYLDKTELSVFAGETGKLTLTILPVLATEEQKQVKWESSDETIATVNGNGVVTGLKVGNVTITVTSLYDETQTVTCAVTVLGARDANIELDTERRSLHIGGSGAAWKVGATLDPMPLEPAAADVVWESSDSSIVSVTAAFENGKHYGVLTTLAAGKVTITAKLASDGMILDTCEIDSFTNENNARPLSTPAEFKAMATGQSYYLTDDIDFSGIEITASYTGNLNSVTLDGRGYALRNIKTNFTSNEQGFIHMLVGLTTIKNVGFYFELGGSGNFQFGGLIRQIDGSAKLENCYFEGTITARHADAKLGPIGSFFGAGSISNCIFNVNFGGNEGLNATNPHLNPRAAIARAFNSNISNCYVNKTLIGDAKVYAAGNGDGAGEKLADGLKTEEELKAAATFDDSWSAWVIEEGSYPRLRTAFDN